MVWISYYYSHRIWLWRRIIIKNNYNSDSPSLVEISDLTTTNQNRCVSENIATIRYEILGAATGVDVTGIDDLSLFEQLSSENQVDRFVINTAYADAGDSYTLTIDQVPYVVTIGEDATAAGGVGVVDLQEEIVQVCCL